MDDIEKTAMAVRHDYACKKCEKTFTAWDDSARICAYCGSKRVFKVFFRPHRPRRRAMPLELTNWPKNS